MHNRFNDARNRLMLKFIVIMLVSFTAYGIFVTYNVYQNVLKNNYENIDLMLDVNVDNLRQSLELIRGTTLALSASDSVEMWRTDQSYFSRGDKESYLNQEKLNKEMQKILTNNNVWNFELFDYVAVYENEKLLAFTYTKPFSTKQIIDTSEKVYEKISNNDNYVMVIPPTANDSTIYTTLRIQMNFTTDDSIYIIGATNEAYFKDKLQGISNYKGALVYLIDKEGKIYSKNQENWGGGKLTSTVTEAVGKNKKTKIKLENKEYVLIKRFVTKEFSLVYLFPELELVKETISGMKSFVLISIVMAVLMILFAAASLFRTTVFIKDFALAMRRVRDKDYDVKLKSYGSPALDELGDTFNLMTGEIKSLIQTTYESKLLLNEMELKFLQHQMNPHFLFNILLTIQIKAKMSGDEAVYRMISSLSSLLRAGIYADKRSVITIREELKYVEYYLELQKERYEERLSYKIEAEEESILDCEIPRLIIEPMVENAIIHGVETSEEAALVEVTLVYDKEDVLIHVKDNGVGFDAQKLKALESVEKQADSESEGVNPREKVGLSNTNQRLKYMYGDRYGLTIHSKENEGTDIEIRIPKRPLKQMKVMVNADDESNRSR